jgi:NDP-sugar pyrophosphorylase family protein
MQALILAGGRGTRLKPFTNNIPKPLVPIGDKPILEIVLTQLRDHGCTEVILAVNHLAGLIKAFFGDGNSLGLRIRYSMESEVMGTAGPIALIDDLEDNFLVMNGDLLTTINYQELFDEHINNNAIATIATYKKKIKIDLGVLKIVDGKFLDYIEKPEQSYDVSTGIYIMNRTVKDFLPKNEKFDMPDLILEL